MKIKVEIEISNIQDWDIDENDKAKQIEYMKQFNKDVMDTLCNNCGIDFYKMKVVSKLIKTEDE